MDPHREANDGQHHNDNDKRDELVHEDGYAKRAR
jgi:hypothetical protein